jgi:cytochrome c oxidase subunit 3
MSDHAAALDSAHAQEPFLQHHFSNAEQQFDAAKIGMWLFLVTEILLFGGLFVGYGILWSRFPAAFASAHHHLNRTMGFINTVVLLVSSFTMVMAVDSARQSKRERLILFLSLTIALAGVFLGIKYFEYMHKIHEGLLPGRLFHYQGAANPREFLFFSFYFMMTGLHGVHIVVGICVLGWVLRRAVRGDFSQRYYTPVDLAGLYWHLVDLIWIYLFPLLYLVG